jgi:hypothetical protein
MKGEDGLSLFQQGGIILSVKNKMQQCAEHYWSWYAHDSWV